MGDIWIWDPYIPYRPHMFKIYGLWDPYISYHPHMRKIYGYGIVHKGILRDEKMVDSNWVFMRIDIQNTIKINSNCMRKITLI